MHLLAISPSPLWFATRGSGWAALALLTVTVTLGVLTAGGARDNLWPRFLSEGLHRNLALVSVAFLGIHIVTAIADPFAKLAWRDAVVPFAAAYRPFWLGLGVIGAELIAAMVVTSLGRHVIGYRAWRWLHWTAYGAWPVALVHSLGTGSDPRTAWSIGLTTSCMAAVLAATGWRLISWPRLSSTTRLALALCLLIFAGGVSGWAADGPLQPGWARRAGTPVSMLGGSRSGPLPAATATGKPGKPTASPSPIPSSAVRDPVVGEYVRIPSGPVRLMLTDVTDPTIQIVVRSPVPGEPGPVLAMVHKGQVGCVAPATVSDVIGATCGKAQVLIELTRSGDGTSVSGWLVIQGG